MSNSLKGKSVVITGSGRSIGREMAIRIAAEGASVALLEINKENLEEVRSTIAAAGGDVRAYEIDLASESQIIETISKVEKDFGKIDCLINNAMVHEAEDLLNTSLEVWNRSIQITLTAAFLCIRQVLPAMIKRKNGSIINIGTVNAKAMIGSDSYSAAKAGVHALTRTVAVRYGVDGIRCNTIVPGTIATAAWQERVDRNPNIFEELKPWYPLGRVGTPKDIADAAIFLISENSQWISGSELVVDGGLLAGYAPMFRTVEGSD
jgi:meso-butanediol dehydrogenase / (S,S)-butanediol dehydrogenase / diacetyl reductase